MKLHFTLVALLTGTALGWTADLRLGIIGADTSHVVAFTEILNNTNAPGHPPGAKVVGLFKGGSRDIESSWSRVEEYTQALQTKYGVKVYDSIEELCRNVDAVLLESVDGRPHLEQVKPVLAAKKRVFVDKPMAGSLKDAIEMFRLAKDAGVPLFSSSALRFASNSLAARHGAIGKVEYAETYGPCEIEPHHPDLFWYGVHGTESLFTVLGKGCQTVRRGKTAEGRIEVTAIWSDGRSGTLREAKDFHGRAQGTRGGMAVGSFDGYEPLVREIVKFFQTGVTPVGPEETIEMFAFMEAADESKQRDGEAVKLKDVLRRAKGGK